MKTLNFSKLLMLVALPLALTFTACKDDNGQPEVPSIKINDSENAALTFSKGSDAKEVTVVANNDWTVESAEEYQWITLSHTTGSTGSTTVTVNVIENENTASRIAKFNFRIALGSSAVTAGTLTVTQTGGNGGGGDGTAIYYETAGTTVSKKDDGYWPYVDEYNGWLRDGSVDQSAVTYTGSSASVRNSGATWDPTDTSIAKAPYAYMANGGYFVIGEVATGGKTNFTFKFAAQHTISSAQNETGAYVPTTGTITASTFGFSAGFNGTDYAKVAYTVNSASDNGWQIVTAEFKVPEGTSTLYFKYDGFAPGSGQSMRYDEFTLTEGGNGNLIEPGGGDPGDETEKTISEIRAMYTGSDMTISDNLVVKGSVVVDLAENNVASLKNIMISDGVKGLTLRLTDDGTAAEFPIGKEVKVKLKGLTLTAYEGLVQINNVPKTAVSLTGNTNVIAHKQVTLTDLLAGADAYQAMPVEITDVQFISDHAGKAINAIVTSGHSYSTLENRSGNHLTVYFSSYSTFYKNANALPNGSGNIKGVATVVKATAPHTAVMLMPQANAEFSSMTGARFSSVETPVFTVAQTTASAAAAANSTATINVTASSNVIWTASLSNTAFASVSPSSSTGNGSAVVTFQENTATTTREVVLTLSTTADVAQKVYTVTITQAASGGGGVPVEFFRETFGTAGTSKDKIAVFSPYDMGPPIVYSDQYGNADVRSTSQISLSVWLPASKNSEFDIQGIESGYTNMTLTFSLAANAANAPKDNIVLLCNGTAVTFATGELLGPVNTFDEISVAIPDGTTHITFFSSETANKIGYRLDNIIIEGAK